MNSKLMLKITVDVFMTAIFIILLFPLTTGVAFHEITGIVIFIVFLFHGLLNFRWIKGVTKNLFNKKTPVKTKMMYILNFVLFIDILTIVITGIMISTVLFPSANVNYDIAFVVLIHKIGSYICGILFLVHISMHSKYLIASFKKLIADRRKMKIISPAGAFMAAVVITGFIFWRAIPESHIESYINESETEQSSEISETDLIISSKSENTEQNEIKTESSSLSEEKADVISLEEYLENLFCTGCHNHCPLISPRCSIGERQEENAINDYEAIYGEQISD